MWRRLENYVSIASCSLEEGGSIRISCPSCGEREFSITKTDGVVLYNCFRATCGVRGVHRPRNSLQELRFRTSKDGEDKLEDVYHPQECKVDQDVSRRISRAFNLSDQREFSVDIHTGRVVFYNYSPTGEIRGATLRRYGEGLGGVTGAKVIFKPTQGYASKMRRPSWYSKDKVGIEDSDLPLFIVEDPVSAMRLADTGRVNAASLMGVYLTYEGWLEVLDMYRPYESGKIIVCLDNDVPERSAGLRSEFVGVYPSSDVELRIPRDDPKDLNDEELNQLIGGAA